MPRLFVLLSHRLTAAQITGAATQLGVAATAVVYLPRELLDRWAGVPPDAALDWSTFLDPFYRWIAEHVTPADYLLVQGEAGATYALVRTCVARGLRPLHTTTERRSEEVTTPDGTVRTVRHFLHRAYRLYHDPTAPPA